jgi:hypothetical protein
MAPRLDDVVDAVGGWALTVIVFDAPDVALEDVPTVNDRLVVPTGIEAVKSTSTLSPTETEQLASRSMVTDPATTAPPLLPACKQVEAVSSTTSTPVGAPVKAVDGVTVIVLLELPDSAAVAVKVTSKLTGPDVVAAPGDAATFVTVLLGTPIV